jgi:eukaryotic-like serine/threonine-protein kinase
VAALDHPHICGIFDVGEANGTLYLVMPLLDGPTLAARLEKGPLPLDQVLKIGAAIADALDKAHRQGIVHRDLKPGNIMLTKTGAKLLDFGLAKLRARGPISMSGTTQLVTMNPATTPGMILGTVQYMAPEQVEGNEADVRSDIWAFGAVLYEMVTGTHPFAGDTPAGVIGAIVRDTPPAISARQPLVPRALDHMVALCLAKDPEERWQNMGDVGRVLESIAVDDTAVPDRRARPGVAWRERLSWVAAAMLLAALAFVTLARRPAVPAGDVVRLSINPPSQMVFAGDVSTVPTPVFAVSPDGRTVAFVAAAPGIRPTLWLRSLHDVDAKQLPGGEDALELFWSPDGQWIGFIDRQGSVKRLAIPTGTMQSIAAGISDPRGASWGPDGTILIGSGQTGLYRVRAAGGTPEPLTELDRSRQEGSHRWPQFLPDGRHYLFTVRSGLAEQRGIHVSDLDGKIRRRLIRSDGDAKYVTPGYLLFLDGDTLVSQAFDTDRLELAGQPVPIAARVGRSGRGNGVFSASSAGTLAFAGVTLVPGSLTWFDRKGTRVGVVGPDGEHDYSDFRLSPDESRLAASLVDSKRAIMNIWLTDLIRGGTSPFALDTAINATPVWSPDGQRIAFRTNRRGLLELYEKIASTGGADRPLLEEASARASGVEHSTLVPTDWSPDGRLIAFTSNLPSDIWLLPVGTGEKPIGFVRSPGDQMHANFSPDGRFIAYTSNESGRHDVYAATLPASDRKWPISINGGYEPRWRADGREIYYLSEDRVLMAVPVSSDTSPFGVPRPLFQTQVHAGVTIVRTHYVPNRDGSRFLIHTRSSDLAPATITVVLNWQSALAARETR